MAKHVTLFSYQKDICCALLIILIQGCAPAVPGDLFFFFFAFRCMTRKSQILQVQNGLPKIFVRAYIPFALFFQPFKWHCISLFGPHTLCKSEPTYVLSYTQCKENSWLEVKLSVLHNCFQHGGKSSKQHNKFGFINGVDTVTWRP